MRLFSGHANWAGLIALLAGLLSASGAKASAPDPGDIPDPPAIVAHVSGTPAAPLASSADDDPKPLSYDEALKEVKATGKPLVVWVGGNFCERCVRDSAADFVHFFTPEFDGVSAPAIVVGVIDSGNLIRAGEVTWWVEGDGEFGHVGSVRGVIRRWLDRREAARRGLGVYSATLMPSVVRVTKVRTVSTVPTIPVVRALAPSPTIYAQPLYYAPTYYVPSYAAQSYSNTVSYAEAVRPFASGPLPAVYGSGPQLYSPSARSHFSPSKSSAG